MPFSGADGLGMSMGSGPFAPSDKEAKILFPTDMSIAAPAWIPAAAAAGNAVGASMGLEPPRGSDWNDGLDSNMAFLDDRHSSSKLPFFQRLGQGQGMNAAGGATLSNGGLTEPFESAFDMSLFGQSAEWRSGAS